MLCSANSCQISWLFSPSIWKCLSGSFWILWLCEQLTKTNFTFRYYWQPCSKLGYDLSFSQSLGHFFPRKPLFFCFPLWFEESETALQQFQNAAECYHSMSVAMRMIDREAVNAHEMWVGLRLSHWFFLITKLLGVTSCNHQQIFYVTHSSSWYWGTLKLI